MKQSKTTACIGIWMDHSKAHLIEFITPPVQTKALESKFANEQKLHSLGKSENVNHNKEQHQRHEFYKNLINVIRNYDEVVLFGPTDAKVELFNILVADQRFNKIKIEVRQADNMSDPEQHAFVRKHFTKHIVKADSSI